MATTSSPKTSRIRQETAKLHVLDENRTQQYSPELARELELDIFEQPKSGNGR